MRRFSPLRFRSVTCALAALTASCGTLVEKPAVDLLASDARLADTQVAGRGRDWVLRQFGDPVRIDDETRRSLPAAPPSRSRFRVQVPRGGELHFAYGVGPDAHGRPPVEFRVRAESGAEATTLWTQQLAPAEHPEHRRWNVARVDLADYAGEIDLVFETSAYDEDPNEADRAFWGTPSVVTPDEGAPLAVIYLVDTLRADHTTPYGYERDTTPELQEFAADAVLFESAIAHASWTKPSVASLMTSKLPGRHLAVQLRDPLDSGHVTLAEMVRAKGVSTGAAIANSVIYGAGNNFDQGFDYFAGLHDAMGRASKSVDAAVVVDAALSWIDSRAGMANFTYVHTMDPHVPYVPPEPFARRYEPHPAPGHPGVDPRTDYKEPLDRERLVAQYDAEIAYGDREFGRFIDGLKARGLYDDALIVFVADHGEEFLDHGKWLHGRSVFDELVRVPLIVKFPKRAHAGSRIPQQVRLVDVLPTVLQSLDLPIPVPPAVSGQSLYDVVAGGAPEPPAFSEISHRGFVAYGLRTRTDKYIQRFSPEEDELYFDLARDPLEQTNVIADHSRRVGRLKAGVAAAMVRDPYRRHLKFVGGGTYSVKLRTSGWIDGVEPIGFSGNDQHEVQGNGRKLDLVVAPRPGAAREVAFSVRPVGAPVWLEGTRDGRPLHPRSISIAEEGIHPPAVPFELPASESEKAHRENVLAPPRGDAPGIHIWLTPVLGRQLLDFDAQTVEQLRALGYIGQ